MMSISDTDEQHELSTTRSAPPERLPRLPVIAALALASLCVCTSFVLLSLVLEQELITDIGSAVRPLAIFGGLIMLPLFALVTLIFTAFAGLVISLFSRHFLFGRLYLVTFGALALCLLNSSIGAVNLLTNDPTPLTITMPSFVQLVIVSAYVATSIKVAFVQRFAALVVGGIVATLTVGGAVVGVFVA